MPKTKEHDACGWVHPSDAPCPEQLELDTDECRRAVRMVRSGLARAAMAADDLEKGYAMAALYNLEKAHYRLERAQTEVVRIARREGASWTVIADAVQMTRQGARQRYRRWLQR